ncbi:eukaryotic translation initiation factor 3 subunit E [Blastocladiella emersonii ATCC 22665]|nr:eukaryotic translation initiation factor 3 subunit E [Blastocladiella emersonii ATCC 22665]
MTATKYDLTATVAKYLDAQLAVPVLRHVAASGAYPAADVLAKALAVASSTSRADLAEEIAEEIKAAGAEPASIADVVARAEETRLKIDNVDDELSAILDVIESDAENLRADRATNSAYIQDKCSISADAIEKLYHHGKLQYDAGMYTEAAKTLDQFRRITTNSELILASQWGKLAAVILAAEGPSPVDTLFRVRDAVEGAPLASASHTLQQRTWLLHWALFVVFRAENGLDRAMELFTDSAYMNAIESAAPWLLRYVVAASTLSAYKNTRDIARFATQERYRVQDPLCNIYEHLFNNIDFESVAASLKDVEELVKVDYFLAPHADALLAGLRKQFLQVIANVYTQLHTEKLVALLGVDAESIPTLADESLTVTMSEDGVTSFSQSAQTRRSLFDKVDRLSHRSDNTMANLYKKP